MKVLPQFEPKKLRNREHPAYVFGTMLRYYQTKFDLIISKTGVVTVILGQLAVAAILD